MTEEEMEEATVYADRDVFSCIGIPDHVVFQVMSRAISPDGVKIPSWEHTHGLGKAFTLVIYPNETAQVMWWEWVAELRRWVRGL